ncbi:MAG: electron-transferring-flavoprotein dehydrogenase [Chlamydiales bacterium]|jgi:electron-transferring-flavoprotein dehydrogenase
MSQRSLSLNCTDVEREELPVDVLLVGAGPASLACAISIQRAFEAKGLKDRSILVIDKAEEIGHHTLSGAVMDPRGMIELFPDWRERGCPVEADVEEDWAEILRPGGKHIALKGLLTPPQLKNHGNVIVSVNKIVRWLAEQAEGMGIDIYPGFPAAEILYDEQDPTRVAGVVTRDSGVAKDGTKKSTFEPGMIIRAGVTVFAEGPRGSLTKHLIKKLGLDQDSNPQTYGTGIKEIWSVPESTGKSMLGKVFHTGGYPLDTQAYGGSFVYGIAPDKLALGFVVGLDYHDARLDPHALFVQWKQHPRIQKLLEGGKVVRYGAKALPEGGYFAMPKLQGDGFCIVGDSAGFLNAATLKGVHLALKSGMLAAAAIADAIEADDTSAARLSSYTTSFEASWARAELWGLRNYRQAFEGGLFSGIIDFAVQKITGGRGLSKRRRGHADHTTTRPVAQSRSVKPSYDDDASMDKLTDVYHSGAIHEEDQPVHLLVMDPSICVDRCTQEYGNPCQHFCPAAVYEWPDAASEVMINASNCVHCKTCDIADPYENIEWVVPEGGGGPKYVDM